MAKIKWSESAERDPEFQARAKAAFDAVLSGDLPPGWSADSAKMALVGPENMRRMREALNSDKGE